MVSWVIKKVSCDIINTFLAVHQTKINLNLKVLLCSQNLRMPLVWNILALGFSLHGIPYRIKVAQQHVHSKRVVVTSCHYWVYASGRQEEEDGKTLVCDNCDRAITYRYVFCRDRHLTLMFSGLLQIDLFKGKWSLEKSYFKQNYCHACHKRFAFFFPLPLSSLLFCHGNCGYKLVK